MKNPSIYLGTILLLTFGSKYILGYIREREFYVLDFLFSIIGLIMIVMSLTKKISSKSQRALNIVVRCSFKSIHISMIAPLYH
ncbi:hypothetical protein CIB87_16535 [Priestia megaterium]|uniref:Uncharacterized protein n=1 Tax=Priestia megaterium TaxID=1404 RepID=A0AA86LWH3_PRIMG|nr:hypothetical protein CIB87_16535 [Priestia megaterium]